MSYKIHVMSRKAIEAHVFEKPSVVISISSPNARLSKLEVSGNIQDILRLVFSDSDPNSDPIWVHGIEPELSEGLAVPPYPKFIITHFNEEMASQILDFYQKYHEDFEVYAHCLGGISRSRGIAAGLCAIYGMDDKEHYEQGQPNAHVKSTLMRVHKHESGDWGN